MSNTEMLEKKKRELYAIYTGLSPYAKRTETWNLSNSKSWGKNWNAGLAFIVSLGGSGNSSVSWSRGIRFCDSSACNNGLCNDESM